MSYQGWTNYETWAVALWIGNDEGWYAIGQAIVSDEKEMDQDDVVYHVAERLKFNVDELTPELPGLFGDLLNGALQNVNWREIADHLVAAWTESC